MRSALLRRSLLWRSLRGSGAWLRSCRHEMRTGLCPGLSVLKLAPSRTSHKFLPVLCSLPVIPKPPLKVCHILYPWLIFHPGKPERAQGGNRMRAVQGPAAVGSQCSITFPRSGPSERRALTGASKENQRAALKIRTSAENQESSPWDRLLTLKTRICSHHKTITILAFSRAFFPSLPPSPSSPVPLEAPRGTMCRCARNSSINSKFHNLGIPCLQCKPLQGWVHTTLTVHSPPGESGLRELTEAALWEGAIPWPWDVTFIYIYRWDTHTHTHTDKGLETDVQKQRQKTTAGNLSACKTVTLMPFRSSDLTTATIQAKSIWRSPKVILKG